jgi:hypothetical protein
VDFAEILVSDVALGVAADGVQALAGLSFEPGRFAGREPYETQRLDTDRLFRFALVD